MSIFDNLFGRRDTPTVAQSVSAVENVVAPSYAQKIRKENDKLRKLIRQHSSQIPLDVYSRIRAMNDTISQVTQYIDGKEVSADFEYSFEALVSDYIPQTVIVYINLDEDDRTLHSSATESLRTDVALLHKGVLELDSKVRHEAKTAAQIQSQFLKERFS